MRPRKSAIRSPQKDMIRIELENLIAFDHPLVLLGKKIPWEPMEQELLPLFDEKGAPAKSFRLMIGLEYLKQTYNLSDEEVVARWVENPYWQYFCGCKWFQYHFPIDPSSMTRWRKRLGKQGAEKLLNSLIQTGFQMHAIKPESLNKVNVDTTVQEKAITYPTDSKLYLKLCVDLVKLAKNSGVNLRQTYVRVNQKLAGKVSRYAHARQYKRMRRALRKLKTHLGRLIRDAERKIAGKPLLEAVFAHIMALGDRLLKQKRTDKKKLYSIHAPEVDCISKGKAHKKYEFGCKVSVVSTSREGFILGAMALPGNPYDGHTLDKCMKQAELLAQSDIKGDVFVDLGYRGHDYKGEAHIHVGMRRKKAYSRRIWGWVKRRSAIEPLIGHMKNDGRLGRNFLKGTLGDEMNIILSACGQNLRLLLRFMMEKCVQNYFKPFSAPVFMLWGALRLIFCRHLRLWRPLKQIQTAA